jgi:hypothetical protein
MIKKLFITSIVLSGGIAAAQSASASLKQGKQALKAGRVHEACADFEASDKLEQSDATEKLLADCYEQDGKHIAAAKMYRKLGSTAKAEKLEKKAPRLRFAINPKPDGLVVKVDGEVVSASEDVRVDVGPHEVTASAPGYEGHASAPVDRDGSVLDVVLRMEATEKPKPVEPPPVVKEKEVEPEAKSEPQVAPKSEHASPEPMVMESHSHRRRNGAVVGGVGILALAGAAVTYVISKDKFDDEHSLCPASKCGNPETLRQANAYLSNGHAYRGTAIGLGIGGVVMVAVGAFLFATPHHGEEEQHVSLSVDHESAGFAYTGRF